MQTLARARHTPRRQLTQKSTTKWTYFFLVVGKSLQMNVALCLLGASFFNAVRGQCFMFCIAVSGVNWVAEILSDGEKSSYFYLYGFETLYTAATAKDRHNLVMHAVAEREYETKTQGQSIEAKSIKELHQRNASMCDCCHLYLWVANSTCTTARVSTEDKLEWFTFRPYQSWFTG